MLKEICFLFKGEQLMISEKWLNWWFRHVPEAESFGMKTKKEICKGVYKEMLATFLYAMFLEFILYVLCTAALFHFLPDYLSARTVLGYNFSSVVWARIIGGFMLLPYVGSAIYFAIRSKKRALQWAVKKELEQTEREEHYHRKLTAADKAVFRKIVAVLTDNEAVRSNLDSCLASPEKYLEEHEDMCWECGFDEPKPEDDFFWTSMIIELAEVGDILCLDWKEYFEEFYVQMEELANKFGLEISEDMFDEEKRFESWCAALNTKWKPQGMCVAAIDPEEESYRLFICSFENLEKLRQLGKKVNKRIDLLPEE